MNAAFVPDPTEESVPLGAVGRVGLALLEGRSPTQVPPLPSVPCVLLE